MMNRATSKASHREIKEDGSEISQANKILEIISIGGDWSLQEIMKAYRAKWGNIELSSVSARVNKLKDPDDPKIIEAAPRKCAITDKTINPLRVKSCSHDRYRSKHYMMYSNAVKAFEKGDVQIIGTTVSECEDCGEDISHANRVKVRNMRETKKFNIIIRGQKSSMICYHGETIEEAEKVCKIKFGDAFENISE